MLRGLDNTGVVAAICCDMIVWLRCTDLVSCEKEGIKLMIIVGANEFVNILQETSVHLVHQVITATFLVHLFYMSSSVRDFDDHRD